MSAARPLPFASVNSIQACGAARRDEVEAPGVGPGGSSSRSGSERSFWIWEADIVAAIQNCKLRQWPTIGRDVRNKKLLAGDVAGGKFAFLTVGERRGGSLLAVALAGTHGRERESNAHRRMCGFRMLASTHALLYMPMLSSYQLTSRRRLSSVRLSHLLRSASSDSSAAHPSRLLGFRSEGWCRGCRL